MRFLVTGGAGFIGSNIIRRILKNSEHEVTVLDNFSTGRKENLKGLTRVRIAEGDVCDRPLVLTLVEQADFVLHLAALVGVRYVLGNRLKAIQTNLVGCWNVFEACRALGKPVLYTSTSSVYGIGYKHPSVEDEPLLMGDPKNGSWAYGFEKAMGEAMIASFMEQGLKGVVVRLFNTVGVNQVSDYGMVLPRMSEAAVKNEPIIVYGDGKQTRSFCSVDDIVEGLYKIVYTKVDNAMGETFNLGSDEEVSIIALAHRVKELAGSSSEIKRIPFEQVYGSDFQEIMRRIPDNGKAKKVLGWEPTKRLDQIIKEIVTDRKERLKK